MSVKALFDRKYGPEAPTPSKIDKNFIITQEKGAITVAIEDQGMPHAVLLVEYIQDKDEGKGKFDAFKAEFSTNLSVLDRCGCGMKSGGVKLDLLGAKVCLKNCLDHYMTWSIAANKIHNLYEDIDRQTKETQQAPKPFSLLGKNSIFSATQTHNCFTWVREMLKKHTDIDLGTKYCEFLALDPASFVPCRNPKALEKDLIESYEGMYAFPMAIMSLSAAVITADTNERGRKEQPILPKEGYSTVLKVSTVISVGGAAFCFARYRFLRSRLYGGKQMIDQAPKNHSLRPQQEELLDPALGSHNPYKELFDG